MLKQQLISADKYSVKCPYSMTPKGICIHNTANDASAANEVAYMSRNDYEVSYHIAIDDVEAIQVMPFNRNAWASGDGGNGDGNRNYIHIEICYSRSGGDRFINAEKRAAKEVAALLKQYGWGISQIRKHQDFSGKYCPHRTLDMGWQRFLNMVQVELNNLNINNYKVEERKDDMKMKNLVCYCNAVDKRAAEYLADHLQCPCIDATLPFDYSNVAENIIAVGGDNPRKGENGQVGFSGYTTKYLKGNDRYETVKEVLKFINKL